MINICILLAHDSFLKSFYDSRYLGTSLMHLGISETPNSIGTFKWRWLRVEMEISLRSTK